ncbi:hypothetical protein BpHYR1_031404 [Brachionus plicatilis]|uniref:Uncharacterized protein n=1 Tax=Brachionus plicatilis TaxID=10195 RepID=A0A3M7T9B3_BRAPC|nr:hypothetical protein BpHYR1_031404 [Brachionus plicatilis]
MYVTKNSLVVSRVVPQVAIFQVFRPKSQVKSKLDLIFLTFLGDLSLPMKSNKTSTQSSRDLDLT